MTTRRMIHPKQKVILLLSHHYYHYYCCSVVLLLLIVSSPVKCVQAFFSDITTTASSQSRIEHHITPLVRISRPRICIEKCLHIGRPSPEAPNAKDPFRSTVPTLATTTALHAIISERRNVRSDWVAEKGSSSPQSVGSSIRIVAVPILQFLLYCFLVALLVVGWEDVLCSSVLPSRQYRTLSIGEQDQVGTTTTTKNLILEYSRPLSAWGQSTVRGMGFGQDDRLLLITSDPNPWNYDDAVEAQEQNELVQQLRSYNEVMLYHRTVRVPQWQADRQRQQEQEQLQLSPKDGDGVTTLASAESYSNAIHSLCDCLASVFELQRQIKNYQWDEVRRTLQSTPWSNLEWAASRLRPVNNAVGFDWGSCAWRGGAAQCNALADVQEALDELDSLLGVLEPYEALFCLDVVERSLRDMLTSVPWENYGHSVDYRFWSKQVPPYQPHRVFEPVDTTTPNVAAGAGGDATIGTDEERIDMNYLEALQALRID